MSESAPVFGEPTWAVLELFGHQVIAGQISEVPIAGVAMLRVDVPPVNGKAGYTKFYGGSAIYGITPTDQGSALHAAQHLDAAPITPYTIPYRQLPPARYTEEDDV